MEEILNNEVLEISFYNYLKYRIEHRFSCEKEKRNIKRNDYSFLLRNNPLSQFIYDKRISEDEIVILLLALIPHVSVNFLSEIVSDFLPEGGDFPSFGGVRGKNHRSILPTAETALFILAGENIEKRKDYINFMLNESDLFKNNIVEIEKVPYGEPKMSGKLILAEEYVHLFLTGKELKPSLSSDFPASLITTGLEWNDLILSPKTAKEIEEIEEWLTHSGTLLNDWEMGSKIKPGYRVLFCGSPGTGKTLTASLLGKFTKRDVYRVDLSLVVSKYIGETEKNLSKLFNKATNKNWILFFDEADAIFGKRTNVRDAHDKYANQEVSYLLQRIEAHPGLVILASNFKNNIDSAFTRRFQSIVEFDLPGYKERLNLWENNLPTKIGLDKNVSLEEIAQKYALTGANIVNIVQYACLKTIAFAKENDSIEPKIQKTFILDGIKKEYLKEGKTVTVN